MLGDSGRPMPVLRVGRLAKWGELGAAISHNHRTRPTPNADPRRQNEVLEKGGIEKAKQLLEKAGATVRDNATLAAEAVFSASPEWFRPNGEKAGEWDNKRLAEWKEKTLAFFGEKFGAENVVSAVLHLDEQTPHLHIIWLPLVKNKEGRRIRETTVNKGTHRLSYHQHLGGSKARLSQLQREYFEALQPLGFDPPRFGSKAEHQSVREYYKGIEAAKAAGQGRAVELPDPADRPILKGKKEWDTEYQEKLEELQSAAKAAGGLKMELEKEQQEKKNLQKRIAELERENRGMKYDLRKLKGTDLIYVMEKILGGEEDKDSRPHHKTRLFVTPEGEKIGITGDLWYNNATQKGGRGALDLIMSIKKIDLMPAAALLSSFVGSDIALADYGQAMAYRNASKVKPAAVEPPKADESRNKQVMDYLAGRGISESVVAAHFGKRIWADSRGNLVMKRNNGGAFLRGTAGEFKQSIGGQHCHGAFLPPPEKTDGTMAIVESPVDGLAFQTLHPHSAVYVTGGNLVRPFAGLIKNIARKYQKLLAAQDNDAAGFRMALDWQNAATEGGLAVERAAPPATCKDWADTTAARRKQEAEAAEARRRQEEEAARAAEARRRQEEERRRIEEAEAAAAEARRQQKAEAAEQARRREKFEAEQARRRAAELPAFFIVAHHTTGCFEKIIDGAFDVSYEDITFHAAEVLRTRYPEFEYTHLLVVYREANQDDVVIAEQLPDYGEAEYYGWTWRKYPDPWTDADEYDNGGDEPEPEDDSPSPF